MAVELSVSGNKKLSTFRKEFSARYPKLGINFYTEEEYKKSLAGSPISRIDANLTFAKVRTVKTSGDLSITGNLKVGSLENKFHKLYGIRAQVCLRDKDGNTFYTGEGYDEQTLHTLNKELEEEGAPDWVN